MWLFARPANLCRCAASVGLVSPRNRRTDPKADIVGTHRRFLQPLYSCSAPPAARTPLHFTPVVRTGPANKQSTFYAPFGRRRRQCSSRLRPSGMRLTRISLSNRPGVRKPNEKFGCCCTTAATLTLFVLFRNANCADSCPAEGGFRCDFINRWERDLARTVSEL